LKRIENPGFIFYIIKLMVCREALFSGDLQCVDIIEENISE
jgi:hypothetical protein